MKQLSLFTILWIASSALASEADTLVTRYWPMFDGDIRYFSGAGGSSYLEFVDEGFGFESRFDMEIYTRESPGDYFDRYGVSTYGYSASGDTLFNYGQRGPIGAYLYFTPAWALLTDGLLAKGGSRTSRFSAGVPYVTEVPVVATVTVKPLPSVTVPAGTFYDCRSVTFTVKAVGRGGASGQAMVLAPRVGPIKLGVLTGAGVRFQLLTSGTVNGVDVRELVAAPVITLQPRGKMVKSGQKTRLFVRAKGSNPLTYQWYFNNAPIAGATQSALALSNLQAANAGDYFVVVENPGGSVASAVAAVTIRTPAR